MNSSAYRAGGLGAIMDEYQKAIAEYVRVLSMISYAEFVETVDPKTEDEHCRSIETITRHIIRSGYAYAGYVLQALKIPAYVPDSDKILIDSIEDAIREVYNMFDFNVSSLYDANRELVDSSLGTIRFMARWGGEYSVEQMLEHAIVHILRHRRQISRFIQNQQASV